MRLIVGLGNPGGHYGRTRHNVGAGALEKAAARWSLSLQTVGSARRGNGRVGPHEVTLATPLTWMNISGLVVKALVDELALPPNDLLVIHDDLDLEPGRLRIKRQGGSGGHNGIHSIVSALGTTQFPRLKIGIGRPAPGVDAAEYVLSSFPPEETDLMDSSLQLAVEALETLLLDGIDVAMNRYNVRSRESEGESEGEAEEESDGA